MTKIKIDSILAQPLRISSSFDISRSIGGNIFDGKVGGGEEERENVSSCVYTDL